MAENISGEGPLSGRDVVFTLDRHYRVPLARRGALSLVLAGIAAVLAGSGFPALVGWPIAAVFGTAGLAYAVRYIWAGRFSARLTAEGIEARGYFDHFVPWSEVTGLNVGGFPVPDGRQTPLAGKPWDSPVVRPGGVGGQGDRAGAYRTKLSTVRVLRSAENARCCEPRLSRPGRVIPSSRRRRCSSASTGKPTAHRWPGSHPGDGQRLTGLGRDAQIRSGRAGAGPGRAGHRGVTVWPCRRPT